MSDSTHRAPVDQRRRQAILWTVVGAIVVITLVLLAFCASTTGDNQAEDQAPGAGPQSSSPGPSARTAPPRSPSATTRPSPTGGAASSPSGTGAPGDAPTATRTPGSPTATRTSAPAIRTSTPVRARSATASPASTRVAPRGGADTGGGSSITGENTIFTALGVITMLAAIGAAVLATRPRRRTRP